MRIIDRYLLRQFVQTFVICYVSLTGIYVMFDAFTNLDAFLHCAKGLQLLKLIGVYYGYQAIFFFDRTCGLLTLMSAMFTVAWIQRHNEMTALMASGVSRIRVVMPVILVGVGINLFATVNREMLIPRCREQLAQRPADLQGNVAQEMCPQCDNETDVLICGKYAYADQKRIDKPDFVLPDTLGEYGKHLLAASAVYCAPTADRPSGYLLSGVQEPKNLAKRPSLALGDRKVVITPRDAAWLQPNECFVTSDVTFDQLNGARAFRMFASTAELIRSLRNRSLDFGADIRVAIHSRMVQPLLDICLLFLGLPLVVSRESRNVFMAIGICMAVVLLFVLVAIGFQQLGSIALLDPAKAAWAPLLIFVPAAVGLCETMWEG